MWSPRGGLMVQGITAKIGTYCGTVNFTTVSQAGYGPDRPPVFAEIKVAVEAFRYNNLFIQHPCVMILPGGKTSLAGCGI